MLQCFCPFQSTEDKPRIFAVFVLICFTLFCGTNSVVYENNDPKFIAGYKSLFTNNLTTYPDSITYNIGYSLTLPQASSYYELVLSINTFEFMECNTIGWNFTKLNITNAGFVFVYEAGINSAIYSLAINYMVVDNFYLDYEIVYYSKRCTVINQGIGYRSENVSYKSLKFSNDSNYAAIVVFQSFNMTNTQYDNVILKNNVYHKNLTVFVEFYTVGLSVVHDLQAYVILYNTAYMLNNMDRIVLIMIESSASPPLSSNVNSASNARFRKRERFFAGISGLNLTRTSNRSFEFKFYQNEVFDFQMNTTGVKAVDFSFLSTYVASCPTLTIYSLASNDCLSACPSTQYPDLTHTLPFCKACHYSCLSCWDWKETSCQSCASPTTRDLSFTGINGGNPYYSCHCKTGYLEVYSTNCQSCNTYLPGCARCSNNATCLECKVGLKLIDSKCVCNNPAFFYSIPDMDCIARIIGCQTHVYDGPNLICTQCYVERNFTLNSSFKCECQQPALQVVQDANLTGDYWCNYICGDGIVGLGEPCDDKNTVSGDGCSSTCQIEANFVCSNLINQPSACLYNFSVELMFHTAERVMYENTAVFNFTFQPSVYFMNAITNWSNLVVTTLPYSKIEDDFKCPDILNGGRCNLTLTIQYTGDLEGQTFEIYLKLSTQNKMKFDSRKLLFTPTGNIATLTYEPDSHLKMLETIDIIVLVLVILGLVIFLASIYFEKMVGVELIFTMQYIYYLMTPIISNPVQMVPFQKNMKFTTGFNQIYNYTYYRYAPLPIQVNHQFYEKDFLMNMNVMLLLLVLALVLLVAIKIYKIVQDKMEKKPLKPKKEEIFQNAEEVKRIQQFDKYYKLYWNKVFFVYIYFVLYQVFFNSVITTLTQIPTENIFSPSLNFLAMFLSLFIVIMGILTVGYWYYQGNKKGSISLSETQIIPYEFHICSKTYIILFTMIQPIKIWIIAIFFLESYCYFITLSCLVIYFIVLTVMRPYKQRDDKGSSLSQEQDQKTYQNLCISMHNFGICFNQFCLIVCNALYMVWNLKAKDNTFMEDYPQLMLYISLFLVFLLELVAVLRLLYKKLGAILFCEYFKTKNPHVITFENSYQKMRKIVRDDDIKPVHNSNQQDSQRNETPQKTQKSKKDRMKILQDLKKAKQFAIDWKDDPKPKYFYNQYKNQYKGSSSESQGQDSPPRDKTIILQSNETSNPDDISYFTNGQQPLRRRSFKNPGVVEMQTLARGAEKVDYKINIASEKKIATLNRSIPDLMMERKKFQDFSLHKKGSNVYAFDAEPQKQRGRSQLEEIKMRMRKEFDMKKSEIKESFFQDQ